MDKEYSIDIIIPTYKPDHTFENLITKLSKQSIKINNIWVINTDKKFFDENKYSKFKNLYIQHIDKKDFDHGGTRNLAAKNSNADILVFMTQDAVPANVNFLEELIKPFSDPLVSAAYGRQVPRKEAKPIEFFTRQFNYPNTDIIKSKNDIERLGIKTFFCTNVCSAFRTEDFWKYGGFPEKTILNEDMIMASKIILDGKKVVYASKAEVIHSHSYTYWQQFTRNFDIAVSLRQNIMPPLSRQFFSFSKLDPPFSNYYFLTFVYSVEGCQGRAQASSS